MWTMAAPSCAARAASSPISRGVYGIAGHWSWVARTPVRAAVMMVRVTALTGWVVSPFQLAQIRWRVVRWRGGNSPGHHPRAVDLLGAGLLEAVDDDPASF